MKYIFIITLLAIFPHIYANEVTNYLQDYAKTGVTDYGLEQTIISQNNLENLVNDLTQFYTDTLTRVRQKAYYLTYKKAIRSKDRNSMATSIILKGCNDVDGGIIGQNVGFLKNFNLEDFTAESAQLINLKLSNHRVQHYTDFVLLAGFIGTGKDILYQKLLDQNVPDKTKWYISLALARMGNSEQLTYCLNKVKKLPVNDNLIDYIIPDLIYTRQKEAIDFCASMLNNNEKLCHSLDPDKYESINCGYRLVELLAKVVVDIPVTLDATGGLSSNNYEVLLTNVKQWFTDNPNYQIKINTY